MAYLTISLKQLCLFLVAGLLVACGGGGDGESRPPATPSAFVYIANYGVGDPPSGSVSAFSVTGDNGILSPVPGSPFDGEVGTVSVAANASNTLLYVLNQSSSLQVFKKNGNGQLELLARHDLGALDRQLFQGKFLRLHPNGRWLYILNDLFPGSILVFSIVESGPDAGKLDRFLQELPMVVPPDEFAISGNFLFVVSSVNNVIGTATISDTGRLTPTTEISLENLPSSLAVHPLGTFLYVANQAGGVEEFTVNTQTGALTFVSRSETGTTPTSVAMDPSGQFLYVTNRGSNNISGYRIADNGNLSPLSSSPFPTNEAPISAAFDPSGNSLYVTHNPFVQSSIGSFSVNRTSGALSSQGASIAMDNSPGQVISIRP